MSGYDSREPKRAKSAPSGNVSIAPLFPGAAAGFPGLTVNTADAISALLAYDPEQDPDAKYFRSRVPVAQRIPSFAATHAQSRLDASPNVINLSQYYLSLSQPGDNALYQYTRYGNTADAFVTRFQQYQDIVGGWQGAQAVPTTAYVDNAHKNGALVIGILYQPYFAGGGGNDFVAQDANDNFLVGDKLVDLAAYFGYDGYFLNIEEGVTSEQAALLHQMFKAMRQRASAKGMAGLILQIYDSILPNGSASYENRFDSGNSGWLTSGEIDSMFINYAWPQHFSQSGWRHADDYVASSIQEAKKDGLDPFKTLFFGLDIEEENDGTHANALDAYAQQVIPPNGASGTGVASLALFDPTLRLARRGIAAAGASPTPTALRQAVYRADRIFWSGSTQNPAQAPAPVAPVTDDTIGAFTTPDYVPHYGVAQFIVERSVIGTFPFFTRFNTGIGDRFARSGSNANPSPWYNAGIQDILPSWQWWVQSSSGSSALTVDYDYTNAYDGGNSLRMSGSLAAGGSTEVRLFKTHLAIPASSSNHRLSVVYFTSERPASGLSVGLVFDDAPAATVWCSLDPGADVTIDSPGPGWLRSTLRLDAFAGRTLAAISLRAMAGSTNVPYYTANIGEIGVYDDAARSQLTLHAPTGFSLEGSQVNQEGSSAQLRLCWDFDPAVWYYDVLCLNTGYDPMWLGRISGNSYYVSSMPRIGSNPGTTIQLVPVAPDPAITSNATLSFSW